MYMCVHVHMYERIFIRSDDVSSFTVTVLWRLTRVDEAGYIYIYIYMYIYVYMYV